MSITAAGMGSSHNTDPHGMYKRPEKQDKAPVSAVQQNPQTGEMKKVDLEQLDGGLTLLQYQLAAHNTAVYPEHGTGSLRALAYLFALLAEEAGEANGKWAKYLRDGTSSEELRQAILLELGDVLWAVALVADEVDESLETVAQMNIDKLASRKDRKVLGGSGDNR